MDLLLLRYWDPDKCGSDVSQTRLNSKALLDLEQQRHTFLLTRQPNAESDEASHSVKRGKGG